jgi:hypothetical protein
MFTGMESTVEKTGTRLANDRFGPGSRGNPLGGRYVSQRVLALFAAFAPEFGGDAMSESTRAELMLICHLKGKAERTSDAAAAAKAGNTARHMIADLRRRLGIKQTMTLPSSSVPDTPLRQRLRGAVAKAKAETENEPVP